MNSRLCQKDMWQCQSIESGGKGIRKMNKLYYFTGKDEDTGVLIGARTWREARNMAIGNDGLHDCDFVDIRGSLCRENRKPVYTEVSGEHDDEEILATGYTQFWSSGECAKCGEWNEHLDPVDGKLICTECQEEEWKGNER